MAGSDLPASHAASATPSGDPRGIFARVAILGRGAESSGQRWGALLAIVLHVAGSASSLLSLSALASFAHLVQTRAASRLDSFLDLTTLPPPEPEPERAPAPEPEPSPRPLAPAPEQPEELPPPSTPAPAAAQAAAVLTSEPSPDEPLDLTNTIISGTAARFSGGITARDGTAKEAVRTRTATANGVVGGTGRAEAAVPDVGRSDRSRSAGLRLGESWSGCPFPPEADAEQQNQAVVRLSVTVGPDGRAQTVTVVEDPGYGFGREARRCALQKTYTPALDKNGKATTSSTPPFRVRFQR